MLEAREFGIQQITNVEDEKKKIRLCDKTKQSDSNCASKSSKSKAPNEKPKKGNKTLQ